MECQEIQREKEMKIFDFAKRGKAREAEFLKFFLATMLGSGCEGLELREREKMVVQ